MKIVIYFLLSMFATQSFAGDKINNGGGLWACVANNVIQSAQLVDLYEARAEFGLVPTVPTSTDVMTLVSERANFISMNFPELGNQLLPTLNEVIQKIRYVDAKLVPIDDTLHRLAPPDSECNQGKWEYIQFADYAEYTAGMSQVLIRKDLWESPVISALDKSALIWHETIYKWLRTKYQDTNSVRARLIVGILYAQLTYEDMKNRIDAVLANPTEPVKPIPTPPPARPQKQWICMLTNRQISSYFSAYADNLKEARVKTKQACQSKSDGIFCPDSALVCDSFESDQEVWSCEYQNHHSGKTYFGKGRSNIEAEFKTRTMCGDAGNSFFCMSVISCEKN